MLTVFESLCEGKTLDDAKAAWANVAEASAKTPGMHRFQSSWHEESKTAYVTEIFDNAECYQAFIGSLDLPIYDSIILASALVCNFEVPLSRYIFETA